MRTLSPPSTADSLASAILRPAATAKPVAGSILRTVRATILGLALVIAALSAGWLVTTLKGTARMETVFRDRVAPLHDLQTIRSTLNALVARPVTEAGRLPDAEAVRTAVGRVETIWAGYLLTYLTPEEAVLVERMKPLLATVLGWERASGATSPPDADIRAAFAALDRVLESLLDLQVRVAAEKLAEARAEVPAAIAAATVGALLALLATVVAARLLERRVLRPIRHSTDWILRLAGGDPHDGRGELAEAHDFAEIAAALHHLTEQLGERQKLMERLAKALETLEEAKDELVESEKLASLGRLVAGIAHELNTPIGSALMVASTLRDRSRGFETLLAGNAIRRAELNNFSGDVGAAAGMMVDTLCRAGELVGSFKQVASDQTSLQRRGFDLGETVEQILVSVRPFHKGSDVTILSSVPPGVAIDSYPGSLGQVITNLVNNAVLHGLDGVAGGQVSVSLRSQDAERVVLAVSDDGHGMTEEVRSRIFEPFFTTRMGSGGTGLGMAIVRNLVVGTLGGRIAVTSAPGQGTTVLVTLPRTLPAQETADKGVVNGALGGAAGKGVTAKAPVAREKVPHGG